MASEFLIPLSNAQLYTVRFLDDMGIVQIAELLTEDSLKGQNLGFPLLPHFRRCAPFFKATMAWEKERKKERSSQTTGCAREKTLHLPKGK